MISKAYYLVFGFLHLGPFTVLKLEDYCGISNKNLRSVLITFYFREKSSYSGWGNLETRVLRIIRSP
jgi:hypothetical protein